jgi:hypothetical protein
MPMTFQQCLDPSLLPVGTKTSGTVAISIFEVAVLHMGRLGISTWWVVLPVMVMAAMYRSQEAMGPPLVVT